MEDICNLYQQSLIPNDELVSSATEQLLSIYENPENISLIIQVINDVPDNKIKGTALWGLSKMMEMHWVSTFNENQEGELIKEQLLNLFQKFQNDTTLSNYTVYCMIPVIQAQGWGWNELVSFLNQTISESTLKAVSYLLGHSLNSSENISQEIYEFCLSVIEQSMNVDDIQVIICSSRVFALLCSFPQQDYSESLFNFLNAYVTIFSGNPDVELAKSISNSFNIENQFFNAEQLLMQLLEISTQSDPKICYIIIRKLISKFGNNLREQFPFLLQTTIEIITSLFSDDCYNPSDDSNYITGIADKCSKRCNSDEFSSLITEILSSTPNDFSELFSLLEIIHSVIDTVNINSPPLYSAMMELISASLNTDNHTIIELSLICIIDLIEYRSELFESNAEEVFKVVLHMLESKHQLIIENSAKVLSLIMYYYKLDNEVTPSLLPSILEAIEESSGSVRANMIIVIYGFAFQMQEEIEPYVSSIIPVIINCIEDQNEEVQRRVIEVLGYIIMYASDECSSIIEESMNLFIGSLDNEDLIESSFLALECSAKSTAGIDPFIELALIKALKISAHDEYEIKTEKYFNNVQAAIKFMDVALRYRPEACNRWRLHIAGCCIANISEDEDVIKHATMAIVRALEDMPMQEQIIEVIITNAESDKKMAVKAAFKAVSYLLKRPEEGVYDELELKMLQIAFNALKRELPSQNSEKMDSQTLANYDNVLFDKVIRFLCRFAEIKTESFPISEFFELIASLVGKVSSYETEVCLSPFVAYKNALDQPTEIDSQLFNLALSLVENCVTNWPFTILKLVICTNEIDQAHIDQIVEICLNRMDSSLSALTLLFVLASRHLFDFREYIPKMIESIPQKIELLPKKGEIEDISTIFKCIFSLIEEFPDIESQFTNIIITKSAFSINKYKDAFPDDTTKLILQFIATVLSNNEQLSDLISDYSYVCKLLSSE